MKTNGSRRNGNGTYSVTQKEKEENLIDYQNLDHTGTWQNKRNYVRKKRSPTLLPRIWTLNNDKDGKEKVEH